MSPLRFSIILVYALLITTQLSKAQFQPTSGPEGGVVEDVIDHKGKLLAGTLGSGIFRSDNGGTSWVTSNIGLLNNRVWCFAQKDSMILAGTSGGVFKSIDNGETWSSTGLTVQVLTITICRNYIFAGSSFNGIYRADIFGNNWVLKNSGLSNLNISSTACYDSIMFTGTQNGVFVSDNYGNSWTYAGLGYMVNDLTVLQSSIFAGVAGNGGLYKSEVGSNFWSYLGNGMAWNENVQAIKQSNGILYAGTLGNGVYRSTNNGISWSMINAGLYEKIVLSLNSQGAKLFAGTQGGGVFTLDSTANIWLSVNNGLVNSQVHCFLTIGNTLYAGTYFNRLHKSDDNGENWGLCSSELPSAPVFSLLASGQTLFCGLGSGYGIYRSIDQGLTWSTCGVSKIIYVLNEFEGKLFAGSNFGIYRSTNDGSSWAPFGTGLPPSTPVFSLLDNGIQLFAGLSGHGVYMSTDQGNTWIAKNNGILSGLNVYSMVKNDSLIFAGTSAGVFRSPDNGEHWFQVNAGLASLSIKVLANAAYGILAGTSNGLYFTSDNGYQWVNVSDGLPDMDIKSVEVSGDIVFVGSGDRGVWRNSLWVVTGIIDAKKPDNVSIYPVPVRKTLTIRSKTPGIFQPNIVICNMMGECIRNTFFNYTDDPMTMDVSSLSPGQYLLVLREAGVIEVEQFIVSK